MTYHDREYHFLVDDILNTGVRKGDRTGTGTIATFGREMRFDLTDNTIPLLTTKKMHTRSIIYELLWYLRGDTNIKYLNDNGVTIWDEWADEKGNLGPVYGQQWRWWPKYEFAGLYESTPGRDDHMGLYALTSSVDQIGQAIKTIRERPNDRRIIVSAWNVADIDEMNLPPCHAFFQFNVLDDKLNCKLTQRSCDVGLGVPFNIVQYSILTCMVAHVTGYQPGEFIWSGGDVHIYLNHVNQLKEQLKRDPYPSPKLWLNPTIKQIDNFKYEDFRIDNYESHSTLKMEVSV